MSFRVMAESKGVSVNKFIFLNDGVHQLMKEENIPVLNTLRKLASTLSVCADASRFFTEDTSVIYARIIGKKVKRDATNMRILYYLDNGVYGSFYNAHINEEPLNPQPIHVASQPSDAVYSTASSAISLAPYSGKRSARACLPAVCSLLQPVWS